MHIRIEYRNDCKRHIAYCSEYHKERGEWGAKQKKEYILDRDGNIIYDPKKRQSCR